LVHLTIRSSESDRQSESYRAIEREPEKDPKPLDSISYGSGMRERFLEIGWELFHLRPRRNCGDRHASNTAITPNNVLSNVFPMAVHASSNPGAPPLSNR
jgi:hypothetical protein